MSKNAVETRICEICGKENNLLRCSKCKAALYCSRSHQQLDWKAHRRHCHRNDEPTLTEIGTDDVTQQKESSDSMSRRIPESSTRVVQQLRSKGYCIIDNFLGRSKALQIHEEVKTLNSKWKFVEGQLSESSTSQNVRGDSITWVDGSEDGCQNIFDLIKMVDCLITFSKDHFKDCNIRGRTKAMVACYPGNGAGYKYHVDNPSGDGRSITALYYLNDNWNTQIHGGVLRMFPELEGKEIFIDPILDRLLLFWSDKRTPHQVEPSFNIRYAITLWYFDADERSRYFNRYLETSFGEKESESNKDSTKVASSEENEANSFLPS